MDLSLAMEPSSFANIPESGALGFVRSLEALWSSAVCNLPLDWLPVAYNSIEERQSGQVARRVGGWAKGCMSLYLVADRVVGYVGY